MIDRDKFFQEVRKRVFGGHISQGQFDGMERILGEWDKRGLADLRWLAYMLATAFWESARTMQPIREGGGEAYLQSKAYYPWVGEGLVQVTWEANHRKFGATAPGQLLEWPIALRALFDGMLQGMFTGKKLSDYFNNGREDWYNARRIVNGTDRASEIAKIAGGFLGALKAASAGAKKPTSSASKIGAGAIVVATGAAAGGHNWIGGDHWMTYFIIGVGFALVLLLGFVAALGKKAKEPEVALPIPKIPEAPFPKSHAPKDLLEIGLAKLGSAGSAWDQAKADIAKAREDMKAEAAALLAAALESEKQEKALETAEPQALEKEQTA